MADFRAKRMPSPEGRGKARAAWEAYSRAVNKVVGPPLQPVLRDVSTTVVADLIGFYVLWHLLGGFEGLRGLGMSRSAIYRRISAFRQAFGVHPDEAEFPGITLDIAAYQAYVKAERAKRSESV
jgi:hypothetical protein